MASSCPVIKITSLKMNSSYPIERAEKLQTRFGEAIVLTLQKSPFTFVNLFVPRRYGALFTENDLNSINEKSVSLALETGNYPT
jgi:hypothetical protein